MPLIALQHIAADSWDVTESAANPPRGFLPAVALGLHPETPEYKAKLNIVLANVADALEERGIDINTDATPASRRIARLFARWFGAEMVLTHSQTGTVADLEGNRVTLSFNDLRQWAQMQERAEEDLAELLPEEVARGGVWLASLGEQGDLEPTYKERFRYASKEY